jgi:hypothetical protein
MKKTKFLIPSLCLIISILICGCINNNTNDNISPKTVVMTAREFSDDMKQFETNSSVSFDFTSLQGGDTLIVEDTISETAYDQSENATAVKFKWQSGERENTSINFVFKGNITGEYKKSDEVNITLHIKHVVFSNATKKFDLEIFEEQWVSEDYFLKNIDYYPFKLLPISCIKKIN